MLFTHIGTDERFDEARHASRLGPNHVDRIGVQLAYARIEETRDTVDGPVGFEERLGQSSPRTDRVGRPRYRSLPSMSFY